MRLKEIRSTRERGPVAGNRLGDVTAFLAHPAPERKRDVRSAPASHLRLSAADRTVTAKQGRSPGNSLKREGREYVETADFTASASTPKALVRQFIVQVKYLTQSSGILM